MSNVTTAVSVKKPLVSGKWIYLPLLGICTYGSLVAAFNGYPHLTLSIVAMWAVFPIFLVTKALEISDDGGDFKIVEKREFIRFCFSTRVIKISKKISSLDKRKYLGKTYYVITGPEHQISLYGIKDKQYERFRAMYNQ
ncbi:hypothetical protein THF1C08_50286 [Vibrio jasicida]|uniref:DUF304 domain-containing protein n=1 Tax=Vibrio jasicida TaxID=766224 RepID=A0AAU9QT39_9VIBR|nr:hypothetical protein [Vibrio alginolyticus]CAH1598878.1 hypothetical protein THF1C08_50286 [Vibrio jasicida]CAH1601474.1 hypothetical protein THF1A12_50060 [Vibrio jasicida]